MSGFLLDTSVVSEMRKGTRADPISQRWALISVPDPVPVVDGLLAATAIEHGLTLVTRNTSYAMRTGVEHVNPFTPP